MYLNGKLNNLPQDLNNDGSDDDNGQTPNIF